MSSESRRSASEYTQLSNFVELNCREHLGKPQARFMYPALTVSFTENSELLESYKLIRYKSLRAESFAQGKVRIYQGYKLKQDRERNLKKKKCMMVNT